MELDKIISAWEYCTDEIGVDNCDKCPYVESRYDGGMLILKKDTIAVLKEHKKVIEDYERVMAPMKPERNMNAYECGVCHEIVGIYRDDACDNYCRNCGKAVDWVALRDKE